MRMRLRLRLRVRVRVRARVTKRHRPARGWPRRVARHHEAARHVAVAVRGAVRAEREHQLIEAALPRTAQIQPNCLEVTAPLCAQRSLARLAREATGPLAQRVAPRAPRVRRAPRHHELRRDPEAGSGRVRRVRRTSCARCSRRISRIRLVRAQAVEQLAPLRVGRAAAPSRGALTAAGACTATRGAPEGVAAGRSVHEH